MTFKHTCYVAFLIAVVMCMGWSLWWMRPYMPAIALELAICGGLLLASGTLATVATLGMGVLALWHWQEGKRHKSKVIPLQEHGSYALAAGGGYQPLMPAAVHVAALTPPISRVSEVVPRDEQQQLDMVPSGLWLPEPYTFSSVLAQFEPTKSGILLAKTNRLITCPIGEPLCHTTFTGNTDSGKTTNERTLLLQLTYLEQTCYVCDTNYQTYRQDRQTGAIYDYTPIEARLAHEPITTAHDALKLMKYLYGELETRRTARRKAIVRFKDIYLFIDELPAFAADEPEIMAYVGRFSRESRQYGIFIIGAAQDLLNSTLKNDNGAIRDNFLTNFYGGGDVTTARKVLCMHKGDTIDETGLGKKGVVYLRAKGANVEREKVRTPLCDNAAITALLGHPSRKLDDAFNELHTDFQELSELSEEDTEQSRESSNFELSRKSESAMKAAVKTVESLPELSEEDERQILQIAQTQLATYGKVIRSKIPAAMTPPRNNAMYPAVKVVLDREGL